MQIVEDDSYALTRFEGEADARAVRPLRQAHGLPLVVLDDDRARPARRLARSSRRRSPTTSPRTRADTYITPSLLSQATVFEFITRGSFERHLGELRAALRLRRDAMLAAIERHMPGATCSRPEGGYFVWLELPGSPTAARCSSARRASRPWRAPRSARCRAGCGSRTAAAAPDEIEAGIERLAARARSR